MMNRATVALLSAGLWGFLTVSCSNQASNNNNNNDDLLKTNIQAKLYADPDTKSGHVNVDVKDGVVTLTGDVPSSDVELAAMKIANSTTGVRSVSDQMKVNSALAQNQLPNTSTSLANNPTPPPVNDQPAPPPVTAAPAPKPAAPAPVRKRPVEPAQRPEPRPEEPVTATIPAGERLSIRTTEMIDSGKASDGQTYRASLDAPLTSQGRVIVPAGAPVTLAIMGVQSAGRIKGNSALSLRPTSLEYRGRNYPINGSVLEEQGKARGKNTAIKTGIGAAAGALI
ncbi:MAG: BON domain-containing protein, partial [Acidobacteriaceae bacterium]|nr:BON domain-containing protein [Acidobacteriaceae bacterium]